MHQISRQSTSARPALSECSQQVMDYISGVQSVSDPTILIALRPTPDFRRVFTVAILEMLESVRTLHRFNGAGIHRTLFDGILLPEQRVRADSPEQLQVITKWQRILTLVNPDINEHKRCEPLIAGGIHATRRALALAILEVFGGKDRITPAGPIIIGMVEALSTYASDRAVNCQNASDLDYVDCDARGDVRAMRAAVLLLMNVFSADTSAARACYDRATILVGPLSSVEHLVGPVKR